MTDSDGEPESDSEDEEARFAREDEIVPTIDSDAQKRPSMYVGTKEFEFSVTGAEGETSSDVEEVFENQLSDVVEVVERIEDDGDPTYQ